jgi:hypothetical protein
MAKPCDCGSPANPDRRAFFVATAVATVAGATVAGATAGTAVPAAPAEAATTDADRRRFMEEATRLAIESVEKGWGGPFGAVIVKDGEIVGRGENRVLLTGCPVFHAEVKPSPCSTRTSPCQERRIAVTPNFERDLTLTSFRAWANKADRHPC